MNDSDIGKIDYVVLDGLLKASPVEDGGRRFIYMEASNEAQDFQDETILAKALEASADYYLKYGNLDLDHLTQLGPRMGIPNYGLYEIGQPVEVKIAGVATYVKAELYTGSGPAAENANAVWASLVEVSPPQRWYPSVGGKVLARDDKDPLRVTKTLWSNIGLSKTPVNPAVPTAAAIPFGAFAKSMSPDGGFDLFKALTAGYGTDSATLTGGGSLRPQSMAGHSHSYFEYRDRISDAIRSGAVGAKAEELIAHSTSFFGLSLTQSAEWVERFFDDLARGLKQHRRLKP